MGMLTEEQKAKLKLVREDASRRKQMDASKGGGGSTVPKVYINDGCSKVRCTLDSEGQYVRTFYRHKVGSLWAQCLGDDCDICEAKDLLGSWTNDWQYGRRAVSLAVGWMDSCDSVNDPKYVKLHQWVILMHGYKLAARLSDLIATEFGDDDEELSKFFDPEEEYPLCKIDSTGKGREFGIGFTRQKLAVSPLPKDFPALSQIFFIDGEKPDPRTVNKFIAKMTEACELAASRDDD